jgi:hypothetical protein
MARYLGEIEKSDDDQTEILGCTHVRGCSPGQEIFTRRRENVDYLGIFRKETFVLRVARNNCYIARTHRAPLVSDPKIHPPLEHPDDLLVRVLMWSGALDRSTITYALRKSVPGASCGRRPEYRSSKQSLFPNCFRFGRIGE